MKMTSEQLRQNAAAMIAFADGKPIEWHPPGSGDKWLETSGLEFIHIYPHRPKPAWTLSRNLPGFRALVDGEEWHRKDFTEEMLAGGWRPLLLGESANKEDEFIRDSWSGWDNCVPSQTGGTDFWRRRTRRPLPALRVKRAWNCANDIPMGLVYLRSNRSEGLSWTIISSAGTGGIRCNGDDGAHYISYSDLVDYEHSTDRQNWKVCEVEEDAK